MHNFNQLYCLAVVQPPAFIYMGRDKFENEEQIQRFLASEAGKSFTLLNEKRIMPQDNGFDGFFMALLQRNQKEIA